MAASVQDQMTFVETNAAAEGAWDIVLTTSPDGANEPWRRGAERVVFVDF
jgi:hypothetical protein